MIGFSTGLGKGLEYTKAWAEGIGFPKARLSIVAFSMAARTESMPTSLLGGI